MKRHFSESRYIVPGLCKGLKTAAIYKDTILQQIKAQLANNEFHREGGQPVNRADAEVVTDEEHREYCWMKRRQRDRNSQST